jgi:proline dehydrogenase
MDKERERAIKLGYASPIQDTKEDTDRDFDTALRFCIENIGHVAICSGTHNEKSSGLLTELMEEFNIDKSDTSVFSSQLLGMSDQISFNLAEAGYNVAKFVPYGPVREVIPYLIRRLEENTSVAGQTGRELKLLVQETDRRKSGNK